MILDEDSSAHYDTLNVQCLSNETLSIYSSGLEVTRMEKVEYISSFEETYNWLNVCIKTDNNCSECHKCIRTMAELDSLGKLDKYDKVFDIKKFNKNKKRIFADIISESRGKDCDAIYSKEIIKNYKLNNNPMPFISYFLSLFPTKNKMKKFAKKYFPKKILKKLMYKVNPNRINDGWMD
jgi:hypothetical protein